jgi:hypothetical protein
VLNYVTGFISLHLIDPLEAYSMVIGRGHCKLLGVVVRNGFYLHLHHCAPCDILFGFTE